MIFVKGFRDNTNIKSILLTYVVFRYEFYKVTACTCDSKLVMRLRARLETSSKDRSDTVIGRLSEQDDKLNEEKKGCDTKSRNNPGTTIRHNNICYQVYV